MPEFAFSPTSALLAAFRSVPLRPFHTLHRARLAASGLLQITRHPPGIQRAQTAVLEGAAFDGHELHGTLLRQRGEGRTPTIVLGGLVPDASEQVYLLRRFLLKSGDVYYLNYPRAGFSLDLLCAQLADLVAELVQAGQPPVIFAVSFGAGVLMDWLRRCRITGDEPLLAGVVLVSPVACVEDLIPPGTAKPTTLIGRALKPILSADGTNVDAAVEKGRMMFLRMFSAGAQNKAALRMLMTAQDAGRLHQTVGDTIRSVTTQGAVQRVRALSNMLAPNRYFSPEFLPLSAAPALVLFAEREDGVMDGQAPTRFAFERAPRAYFPHGVVDQVTARAGAPVQHASLIFHVVNFLPHLQAFYQRVRRGPFALAA